jgi:hypothetical protein
VGKVYFGPGLLQRSFFGRRGTKQNVGARGLISVIDPTSLIGGLIPHLSSFPFNPL